MALSRGWFPMIVGLEVLLFLVGFLAFLLFSP